MAGLGFNPVLLGFALASLGYAIGLAFRYSPMSEGRSWGGQLMSYSLLTAMFLAVAGSGEALGSLASSISGIVVGQAGLETVRDVGEIPSLYFTVATNAMGILAAIAGSSTALALIPIVGPTIANVLSVFSTLPSMALTGAMILSMIIAVTAMIFITFAPAMIPVGVVLIAVPGGRLKGLGGWLIAMSLALTAVGPLIPAVGLVACRQGGASCSLSDMSQKMDWGKVFSGTVEGLLGKMFDQNSIIMRMWSFTLGSMIAFTIMSVTAAALSRAIGGVAASLGIG
jgi:hypothetical protein